MTSAAYWSDGAAGPVLNLAAGDPEPFAWMSYGKCRSGNPDLFTSESEKDIAAAKAVCARCFVRADCLDYASALGNVSGVWGGELFAEGRLVRPPKPKKPPKRKRGPRPGRVPRDPRVCRNGHRRTLVNTRKDKQGRLVCRDCQAARNRRTRLRKRSARRQEIAA